MRLRTRTYSRLLRSVFAFAVLLCTTHANNSIFENFDDLNECTGSDQYLCGCQAVPVAEMPEIKTLLGQELPCEQLCEQQTCEQECDESVCSVRMGNFGEYCTKTSLPQYKVNFVRSASCSYNQDMMVYECVKGDSVAYPNNQTYNAIIDGYCIPSCGLDAERFECKFDPWFREETDIKPEDTENAPFTAIAGADPRTTETTDSDAELPSGDIGLGPIKTPLSPEEEDDVESMDPKVDPVLTLSSLAESSTPSPSEAPEVSEPTKSEPIEAPVEEPQVQPIDEPSTGEKSTPAPAPESEDTPAPAPESKDTPAPAPASDDTPAPAPDETPAPAPASDETPAPAPDDTPAPAPESKDTPAPAPESKDTPAPAPASDDALASEEAGQTPDLEETPAPEPEPESLDDEEPPSSERPFVPVVSVVPSTGTTVSTLSSRSADTPAASRTSNAEVTYWPIIAGACLLGLLLISLIAFVVLRRRKDSRKPIATFLRDALPEGQMDEEDPVPSGRYDRMTSGAEQATAPAVISSR